MDGRIRNIDLDGVTLLDEADGAAGGCLGADMADGYDIDDTAKMTEEIQSSDIFANATIVGMKPLDDQSVVKDLSAFRPGLVVADAVYNPEETKLLREAKEAGCTCVGGKGMLLWQGVAAFKLYTGQDMPVDDVKKLFFS